MKRGLSDRFWRMTPFQIAAVALAERGVTSLDLAGDRRRHDGTVADLLMIAGAAGRNA